MAKIHANLAKLDELRPTLCYEGWELDFRDAEDAHSEREHSFDFPKTLRKMKVKQKLHDGDRTHPRLVALDAIMQHLSYPGWQVDVRQVEKMHAEVPYRANADIGFNSKLRSLSLSQNLFNQTGKVVSQNDGPQRLTKVRSAPASIRPTSIDLGATKLSSSDRVSKDALGSCIVCGDEAKTIAFIPCGHLCCCEECASKVMRRAPKCPVCRGTAMDTVQIFL